MEMNRNTHEPKVSGNHSRTFLKKFRPAVCMLVVLLTKQRNLLHEGDSNWPNWPYLIPSKIISPFQKKSPRPLQFAICPGRDRCSGYQHGERRTNHWPSAEVRSLQGKLGRDRGLSPGRGKGSGQTHQLSQSWTKLFWGGRNSATNHHLFIYTDIICVFIYIYTRAYLHILNTHSTYFPCVRSWDLGSSPANTVCNRLAPWKIPQLVASWLSQLES